MERAAAGRCEARWPMLTRTRRPAGGGHVATSPAAKLSGRLVRSAASQRHVADLQASLLSQGPRGAAPMATTTTSAGPPRRPRTSARGDPALVPRNWRALDPRETELTPCARCRSANRWPSRGRLTVQRGGSVPAPLRAGLSRGAAAATSRPIQPAPTMTTGLLAGDRGSTLASASESAAVRR